MWNNVSVRASSGRWAFGIMELQPQHQPPQRPSFRPYASGFPQKLPYTVIRNAGPLPINNAEQGSLWQPSCDIAGLSQQQQYNDTGSTNNSAGLRCLQEQNVPVGIPVGVIPMHTQVPTLQSVNTYADHILPAGHSIRTHHKVASSPVIGKQQDSGTYISQNMQDRVLNPNQTKYKPYHGHTGEVSSQSLNLSEGGKNVFSGIACNTNHTNHYSSTFMPRPSRHVHPRTREAQLPQPFASRVSMTQPPRVGNNWPSFLNPKEKIAVGSQVTVCNISSLPSCLQLQGHTFNQENQQYVHTLPSTLNGQFYDGKGTIMGSGFPTRPLLQKGESGIMSSAMLPSQWHMKSAIDGGNHLPQCLESENPASSKSSPQAYESNFAYNKHCRGVNSQSQSGCLARNMNLEAGNCHNYVKQSHCPQIETPLAAGYRNGENDLFYSGRCKQHFHGLRKEEWHINVMCTSTDYTNAVSLDESRFTSDNASQLVNGCQDMLKELDGTEGDRVGACCMWPESKPVKEEGPFSPMNNESRQSPAFRVSDRRLAGNSAELKNCFHPCKSPSTDMAVYPGSQARCEEGGCTFWFSGDIVKGHEVRKYYSTSTQPISDTSMVWQSEEEVACWLEERRNNYPTRANVLRKMEGEKLMKDLLDEESLKRRQRMREVLHWQKVLGVLVADIPDYYFYPGTQATLDMPGSFSSKRASVSGASNPVDVLEAVKLVDGNSIVDELLVTTLKVNGDNQGSDMKHADAKSMLEVKLPIEISKVGMTSRINEVKLVDGNSIIEEHAAKVLKLDMADVFDSQFYPETQAKVQISGSVKSKRSTQCGPLNCLNESQLVKPADKSLMFEELAVISKVDNDAKDSSVKLVEDNSMLKEPPFKMSKVGTDMKHSRVNCADQNCMLEEPLVRASKTEIHSKSGWVKSVDEDFMTREHSGKISQGNLGLRGDGVNLMDESSEEISGKSLKVDNRGNESKSLNLNFMLEEPSRKMSKMDLDSEGKGMSVYEENCKLKKPPQQVEMDSKDAVVNPSVGEKSMEAATQRESGILLQCCRFLVNNIFLASWPSTPLKHFEYIGDGSVDGEGALDITNHSMNGETLATADNPSNIYNTSLSGDESVLSHACQVPATDFFGDLPSVTLVQPPVLPEVSGAFIAAYCQNLGMERLCASTTQTFIGGALPLMYSEQISHTPSIWKGSHGDYHVDTEVDDILNEGMYEETEFLDELFDVNLLFADSVDLPMILDSK